MIIEKMVVGDLGANCFIIACDRTKEAMVIDPGGEGRKISDKISSLQIKPKYIINTHGHVDHIGGNDYLKQLTDAVLAIHPDDANMLTDPDQNLSSFTGSQIRSPEADEFLREGKEVKLGDLTAEIIATPGHTQGGICIQINENLFSGDTLFLEGIGRCDLPGGDYEQLIQSIQKKLMVKSEDITVYPGHGPATTIGHEKNNNPFLTR